MSNCWLVACIENSVFNDIDKEVIVQQQIIDG